MKKLFPYFLIFLSILSLVSCTVTKRKYTGGFYVNWHKKAPETTVNTQAKIILPTSSKISQPILPQEKNSVEEKPGSGNISIFIKHPKKELEKITTTISANAGTLVNEATKEGSTTTNAPDKRFLDRGLAGFEAALLDLIVFGLLILFAHWGYSVFVLGCLLLIIALSIYSLIYCFMGLNTNDRHRGLAFVGLLLTIGVIVGVFLVGL